MKGDYTRQTFGTIHPFVGDHAQMKGDYTFVFNSFSPHAVGDHAQMKGDYTLGLPKGGLRRLETTPK